MISSWFSDLISLVNSLLSRWFLPLVCVVVSIGVGSTVLGDEPQQIGNATQLFVDDFLIYHKERVVRRVQQAAKMEKPVLTPDHPWEFSYHPEDDGVGKRIYVYGTVFFDSLQGQYRMWYMSRMSHRHDFRHTGTRNPGRR